MASDKSWSFTTAGVALSAARVGVCSTLCSGATLRESAA